MKTKKREGALNANPGYTKELVDFWLTRSPRLYLFVEERRRWLSWDRRVYLSIIRPGDTVLDIGANVGAHTVLFSHLAGSNGRVLSFEPLPSNLAQLRENVARRGRFQNVEVFPVAVGGPEASGSVTLLVPGGDFTQASLRAHAAGSWVHGSKTESYECPITSIDHHFHALPMERVDLMKIDVEGAELEVLRGAQGLLAQYQPMIYCELFSEWTRAFSYSPEDLVAFLMSLGYTEARVIRGAHVSAYRLDAAIPSELFDVSTNVLFNAPDHADRVRRFDQRFEIERAQQD